MDEKIPFIVYCIEEYKTAEKLTGKEVIELFNKYRGLYSFVLQSFVHDRTAIYCKRYKSLY